VSRHRKKKAGPSENAPAVAAASGRDSVPTAPPASSESARAPASRRSLKFAIGLAISWWTILILLVIFTANPVVLNYRQIAESDYVVTGRVVDRTLGRVEVLKEWQPAPSRAEPLQPGVIEVTNLPEVTTASRGDEFLFPLQRVGRRFEVTPARALNNRPLIYPVTPVAEKQLEQILAAPRGRL